MFSVPPKLIVRSGVTQAATGTLAGWSGRTGIGKATFVRGPSAAANASRSVAIGRPSGVRSVNVIAGRLGPPVRISNWTWPVCAGRSRPFTQSVRPGPTGSTKPRVRMLSVPV